MGTLGRLAFVMIAVPLLAQQKEARPVPVPRPVQTPVPVPPKPPLPVAVPQAPPDADHIDKRRERMKDRDAEIDRMMKEKAKQQR